ncbi:MAG: monofunctional biosynthetic peptidoglycan transglycosylase [Pseudomonadota bacterium]|nr:monofunctional biosynthetic peptidoglycan transglycosylase [Pseudomonadota bacterium]
MNKGRKASGTVAGGFRARALRWGAVAAALAVGLPLLAILLYAFIDPPYSALMLRQRLAGTQIRHSWVPLQRISKNLVRAVVTSEDARFCRHWGVDWNAVSDAIEEADEEGGSIRGASTIPMQTAKNLFLWSDRSYVRKAAEIPLAYVMSTLWTKRRMIEIYLNIAEWGPGVFGVQAAARHHFRKNASDLTPGEGALLAAALPNPHVRRAGRPGPRTRALASRLQVRAASEGVPLDCIYRDN